VERLGDIALILSALIFKALVVKRLRQIPSDRELYRRL